MTPADTVKAILGQDPIFIEPTEKEAGNSFECVIGTSVTFVSQNISYIESKLNSEKKDRKIQSTLERLKALSKLIEAGHALAMEALSYDQRMKFEHLAARHLVLLEKEPVSGHVFLISKNLREFYRKN